jgi:cAMP-specific phosphodiesterase 4
MVFSGAALSSVVTALAVTPLENMFGVVRQIATTVFKFSANAEIEDDEDEAFDVDSSEEMRLLEKVVQKLSVIASLQMTSMEKMTHANLESEDIAILSMVEGKNLLEEKIKADRRSMAPVRKQAHNVAIKLDTCGISQEDYNSFGFNTMTLDKKSAPIVMFTIANFHDRSEGFIQGPEDEVILEHFVQAVEKEYLPNPFHNFSHAADVLHYTARIMRMMNSEAFLTELEQFSLLIAAVGHDIGHPGVNNAFLSEVSDELALEYNDMAPLENMHCSRLYSLINIPDNNVFLPLKKEQYKESRRVIIESILHTDMMVHMAMVNSLKMVFEMNSEVFARRYDPNYEMVTHLCEIDLFNKDENKLLALECILHAADVSNPCRVWETTKAWAWCVLEEFFSQGDKEKELGVPVGFLNDRCTLNRPNSQIGFLEFMIAPFFVSQIKLWPKLHQFGDHLSTNIGQWEQMWADETSPDDEGRSKTQARVRKVQANLDEAKSCGGERPE